MSSVVRSVARVVDANDAKLPHTFCETGVYRSSHRLDNFVGAFAVRSGNSNTGPKLQGKGSTARRTTPMTFASHFSDVQNSITRIRCSEVFQTCTLLLNNCKMRCHPAYGRHASSSPGTAASIPHWASISERIEDQIPLTAYWFPMHDHSTHIVFSLR